MTRSDTPVRVPPANHLLAALPPKEFNRLRPHLEPVTLNTRAVLHDPGRPIAHAYFPTSGVVSLLARFLQGGSIEVGMVGREGVIGLPLVLGVGAAQHRCLVQVPGEAYRLPAATFRDLAAPGSALHGLLLRYTHAFVAGLSQCVGCNSLHPIERRLCRWLLQVHSRAESNRLPLTQELLASMLGVRRASVSVVSRRLQEAGLIQCSRGHVAVLDRQGLEAASCECYHAIQNAVVELFN